MCKGGCGKGEACCPSSIFPFGIIGSIGIHSPKKWCLRCHSPTGWLSGRASLPTGSADGCSLNGEIDGVDNDLDGREDGTAGAYDCNDGIDNDSDGAIEEGCAPCP